MSVKCRRVIQRARIKTTLFQKILKRINQNNKKLAKFKRNKERKLSDIVLALGSNYKLKKILQGKVIPY